MKSCLRVLAMAAVWLAIGGCGRQAPTPSSPFRLTASIQDIMLSEVDPAADALWDSVSTTYTSKGTDEHRPRTDEDWTALRHHAITLLEATNLLVMDGRRVAAENQTLQDSNTPGVLTSAEIQQKIDRDHSLLVKRAHALHDAAMLALTAIDKKDVEALENAGGMIDTACEQCHLTYWYPDPAPPKTSP
jgi:hypothetical protein